MIPHNNRDDDPRFYARYPHPILARHVAQDGPLKTFRSLAWPTWGLVYHLAQSVIPSRGDQCNFAEIGVDTGLTTIVLAQALIDANVRGVVYAFDNNDAALGVAQAHAQEAGTASRTVHVAGDFGLQSVLPADLYFALVDFTKDVTLNAVAIMHCWHALSPGGLLMIDNVWCRGVHEAVTGFERIVGRPCIWLPHASWGLWPPPEGPRGGTPGMAMMQKDV